MVDMEVPRFKKYYPSTSDMDSLQLKFYKYLKGSIEAGKYPYVDGQISYLFILAYEIIDRGIEEGFQYIYDNLFEIAERYHNETNFSNYCRTWAYDCLIGIEDYNKFLDLGQHDVCYGTNTHYSNYRLNIQKIAQKEADPIDLFRMASGTASPLIKLNSGLYREILIDTFENEVSENGPWFDRMMKYLGKMPKTYPHNLFNGTRFYWKSNLHFYSFYSNEKILNIIKNCGRLAENNMREIMGLPKIGEGWISETELFFSLKNAYPETQVIQHGRPPWLGRQHLDIWFPRWKIAVEYHGKQHFEPVDFFGGEEAYIKNVERDERKKGLCKENNVKLLVVTSEHDHKLIIQTIRKYHYKK